MSFTLLFELNDLPTEERVKELLVTKQTVPDVAVNMPALSIYDGLWLFLGGGVAYYVQ